MKRLPRYLLIGLTSTGCHYLLFAALLAASAPPWWAGVSGSVAGAIVGFILNRHYCFIGDSGFTLCRLRYFCVATSQLLCNALLLALLLTHLEGALLSQLIATALVFALGFAANSLWSYRSNHHAIVH